MAYLPLVPIEDIPITSEDVKNFECGQSTTLLQEQESIDLDNAYDHDFDSDVYTDPNDFKTKTE